MAPVEIMFRAILVAVPALSRVDPESTSGPVISSMEISASCAMGEAALHTMAPVFAPTARAYSSAPRQ